MSLPKFVRTIRFRMTVWFVVLIMLLQIALVVGVNLAMWQYRSALPGGFPQDASEFTAWIEAHGGDLNQFLEYLRQYSGIGVLLVVSIGAVCGYWLSGIMLKPVDRVSSLAARISFSNLKERLDYKGTNDEIKHLADTFDAMLARLEAAIESQKQFVQDASHELRTPIATALTNIEVLDMNEAATLADYRRASEVIKRNLDRMNNINTNLLLLSEEASPIAEHSIINLGVLISDIVKDSEAAAAAKGIILQWTLPDAQINVSGDAFNLRRVFLNLITNAVNYNCPGGSVRLSLLPEDNTVIVEVADTGIGIPEEDQARIFDRFYRVDKSRSRDLGGSGLGLAIVKKIVEEHRGRVTVQSVPDQGSTFRITLPVYPSRKKTR